MPDAPEHTAERPAAIIGEQPIPVSELFPLLAELSGPQVLRELALDGELGRELAARGLAVTEPMIEAERERLLRTLVPDETEGFSDRLAADVLASRGLGPERRRNLLWRNAALRMLVQDRVEVSPTAVELAYRVRHGERRVVRVIVTRSAAEAGRIAAAVRSRADEVGLPAAFAEAAFDRSIDPTAALGGLLGELSTLDPGVTAALRTAVRDASVGVLGPIVAIEDAFALVLVERDVPADPVGLEEVRARITDEVRRRAERLEMDALAESLIDRAGVSPLNASLRWAWERTGPR